MKYKYVPIVLIVNFFFLNISPDVGSVLQERRQRAIERLNSTSEMDPSLLQAPEPPSLSPIIQDDGQIFFGNTNDTKT